MPRPNKNWEKKYGHKSKTPAKVCRLSATDTILTAAEKLAGSMDNESYAIILQGLKCTDNPIIRLLDMDDMQMFDGKIARCYHEWAGNDYDKFMSGIAHRADSLTKFLKTI